MATKIEIEDALKHLRICECEGGEATLHSVAGALGITPARVSAVVAELLNGGFVESVGSGWALTETGRGYGNEILRAHRLYETYLANKTGSPASRWHAIADVKEHELHADEVARLERDLGRPRFDPHGDPIPTVDGSLPDGEGIPLTDFPLGTVGAIDHLEDEPEPVFAALEKLGLAPGMRIKPLHSGFRQIQVELEGRIIELDRVLAANVRVAASDPAESKKTQRLSDLTFGDTAHIAGIGRNCRGNERRRLLDMGIVSGNLIQADRQAPFGGPRAYRVCGSVVALRREQAERIFVTQEENEHE